jgi:hypothetical protein
VNTLDAGRRRGQELAEKTKGDRETTSIKVGPDRLADLKVSSNLDRGLVVKVLLATGPKKVLLAILLGLDKYVLILSTLATISCVFFVTWGGIIFHPKNMTPGIHQFALNSKDWLV